MLLIALIRYNNLIYIKTYGLWQSNRHIDERIYTLTEGKKHRNTFVVLDFFSRLKTFKLKLKEQDSSAEEK